MKKLIKLFFKFYPRHWYHPMPWFGRMDRINRHGPRLTIIKKHIKIKPAFILDIGCHIGFYSLSLARDGHIVTALDYKKPLKILRLQKWILGIDNPEILTKRLTPENCYMLNQYDYILYLGLHHHICRQFGFLNAFQMLKQLLLDTRYMFFTMEEPHTDKQVEEWETIFPPNYMAYPVEWLRDWFDAHNVKNEIIYKGPKRHLFLLET